MNERMVVQKIDDQGDRVLLYGDAINFHVIAPKGFKVANGAVIEYELGGWNFGWLIQPAPTPENAGDVENTVEYWKQIAADNLKLASDNGDEIRRLQAELAAVRIEAQANGETAMQWKAMFEDQQRRADAIEAERARLRAALTDEDRLIEFANLCSRYPREARLTLFDRVFGDALAASGDAGEQE